ncbi:hypothetical protein AB0L85_23790 [Streptomyces sp. NPDC052051]|uniref:hypothetical protein n=1 Tax=Streptomyces sp. NPDC052051 TaxID=3154649 RepID=UPI00341392C5
MSGLAVDTYFTFCKGLPLPALRTACAEQGAKPFRDSGEQPDGWSWIAHEAYVAEGRGGQDPWRLARTLSGYRRMGAAPVETVFLASTPACACPHGRHVRVPHCPEHPIQFAYFKAGWEQLYFNLGSRRESSRGGTQSDLLTRELLTAGLVGRDAHGYDENPDFNADGHHTIRILTTHFGLPSPPLHLTGHADGS